MFKNSFNFYVLTALCLFFIGCGSEKQAPPQKPPFPMVTAENLFAVDVLDQQHVWIVGFNSVIVHTPDGGKTWNMQKSGVTVPLCDVSFVNIQTGWIAGRVGTLLSTEDGGKTWETQSSGTNRNLFGLCFVDELYGWAVGEFGTILHTSNGFSQHACRIRVGTVPQDDSKENHRHLRIRTFFP